MAQREAERMLAEAQRARKTAETERAEAETIRATARQEALAEVEQELADARSALRRIRQLPERLPAPEIAPLVRESKQELERATQEVRQVVRRKPAAAPRREPLRVGDHVELTALGGEGEVLGFSDDGSEVDVQMGPFKVRQPLVSLRKISDHKVPAPEYRPPALPMPSRRVDMELHLRGQRAAGVDEIVDDYLNDAYLSRLPYVRIVHGKGTGALREVVRQVVAKHPLVERWENPPHNEGGDGVTVVYLRES